MKNLGFSIVVAVASVILAVLLCAVSRGAEPWWEWSLGPVPEVLRTAQPPTYGQTIEVPVTVTVVSVPRQWFTDNNKALEAGLEARCPVLVYWTAPWCSPCKRMRSETWASPDVARAVSGRYVLCQLNYDEHPDLARRYGVTQLPTTVLVSGPNPKQLILRQRVGYFSPADLIEWLSAETPNSRKEN